MRFKQWTAHLRSASWARLLAVSALLAALLAALVYVVISYNYWHLSKAEWAQHVASGTAARCEAIGLACSEEFKAKQQALKDDVPMTGDSSRNSTPWQRDPVLDYLACTDRLEREAALRVDQWGREFRLCGISEPSKFAAALTSSDYINRVKPVGIALVTWGLLVAAIAMVRLFGAETNKGWRRLAFLSGGVGAVAGALYVAEEGMGDVEAVATTLATSVAAFAAILMGRLIYQWVTEGFKSSASSTPPESSLVPADSAKTESKAPMPVNRILGGMAVALFLLAAFVINPDAAIKTYISTLVQAIGLVVVWYGGKALLTAIRNRQNR
jgi:hypothetical protein